MTEDRDHRHAIGVARSLEPPPAVADEAQPVDCDSTTVVGGPTAAAWCVYLIECRNGAYYAGITNRLEARYAAHAAGRGARYTRANPPVRLIGSRWFADRSAAARAEWRIRRLPRHQKLLYLSGAIEPDDAVA